MFFQPIYVDDDGKRFSLRSRVVKMQFSSRFSFLGKTQNGNQKVSPSKISPTKKTPTKNTLKPPTTAKPSRASPARSQKSNNKTSSGGDSSSMNASPEKKVSDAKSFTTFSEQPNENDYAKSMGEDSSQPKSEGIDLIIE